MLGLLGTLVALLVTVKRKEGVIYLEFSHSFSLYGFIFQLRPRHLEYQMREKHGEELSRFIEGWIDLSGKNQNWKK
ncbi:MAG: hypothetical protein KKD96_12135 [Proteobacteria bacterium]|nr:hypothetical protein [Pseudomonadota bacterium]